VDRLVIDYDLLFTAAGQLDALKSDTQNLQDLNNITNTSAVDGSTDGSVTQTNILGPGNLDDTVNRFLQAWHGPLHDAGNNLQTLSDTFKGVAHAFFDADASQISGINTGIALSQVRNYPAEEKAYEQALTQYEQLKDPNHVPYYDINGNVQNMSVPKPTPPTAPTGSYTGPGGVVTTYTTGAPDPNDPNQGPSIIKETTSISDPATGMSDTETTLFSPSKGWNSNGPIQDTRTYVTHSDGSTDTIITENNTDGSAQQIDAHHDPNGHETMTVSTKGGPNDRWVTTN
jgi:hypothetical protein